MNQYLFILIWCAFSLLWMALYSFLPVIWHFQHKKKMRKYILQVREAFDGVLLNDRERLLLQAYLDEMECIGLQDEVIADFQKSKNEKVQHVLDELGAIRNDSRGKDGI